MMNHAKTKCSSKKIVCNFVSDTITKPCEKMREIMQKAAVGDDVFGNDPSVNYLQDKVAKMLGKEDALFVPSGTMGNLIAVGVHCQRGDEIILGDKSHIFTYEGAGTSGE